MKKTFYILLLILSFTLFPSASLAAKPTATNTPTPTTSLQAQVDELKNKIASKVASLKLVEKKGVYGTVSDVSDTQLTITNINGENRFIDIDELTKFTSSASKSFGISDVKKGMHISVLGLYNKDSQRLQARVIFEDSSLPNFINGAVFAINDKDYTFTVAKANGAKNLIDVESISKTYSFVNNKMIKSGFSKMELGETVIVVGYPNKTDKTKTLASRIYLFPEISANTSIDLNPNQPTVVPSTGSGKKLTPIVR